MATLPLSLVQLQVPLNRLSKVSPQCGPRQVYPGRVSHVKKLAVGPRPVTLTHVVPPTHPWL